MVEVLLILQHKQAVAEVVAVADLMVAVAELMV
jgi:hypothetical protein